MISRPDCAHCDGFVFSDRERLCPSCQAPVCPNCFNDLLMVVSRFSCVGSSSRAKAPLCPAAAIRDGLFIDVDGGELDAEPPAAERSA